MSTLGRGFRWSTLIAHIEADPTPPDETERIHAIADQHDGADADSAFVAEQMRAAVEPPYVGFDYPEIGTESAPRSWLARAAARIAR